MGLIIVRTCIIFITLLLIMRLMGKRQIGEMQPFEFVITLLIAELACIPMADTSIPLLYGIVSIVTIYFLHQIVCIIDLGIKPLKGVISGQPAVVINKNGVDEKQLKMNNLDVSDLIESMRGAGYFSLDVVDYALYEANGSFSALPKSDYEETQTSLPIIIADFGKYDTKNIELTGLKQSFFDNILKKNNIKSVKKVCVFTLDPEGKIYLQESGKKYKVLNINLPGETKW